MKNFFILAFVLFLFSCQESKRKKRNTAKKKYQEIPIFNSDSSYNFVKKQVDFGPRVPNTSAHKKCGNYLAESLKKYSDNIIIQETTVKSYDGKNLQIKNIIGEFNVEETNRFLLAAHWDSRPFADAEENQDLRKKAILGANDGASGIGVLLEIARLLKKTPPINFGVDIIFFDAEDYGEANSTNLRTWCLGSQYWAKNQHREDYYAKYGIVLDMVGGKNAVFTREAISMKYAPYFMDKVWNNAVKISYSDYFSFERTQFIGTDDHEIINIFANIPCIDIVQYEEKNKSFADYWHTHNDNMKSIDKNTLKAVGQTVLQTIFTE